MTLPVTHKKKDKIAKSFRNNISQGHPSNNFISLTLKPTEKIDLQQEQKGYLLLL
jgi:hypothetical protein